MVLIIIYLLGILVVQCFGIWRNPYIEKQDMIDLSLISVLWPLFVTQVLIFIVKIWQH